MNRKWLVAAIILSGLGYLFALGFDQLLFRWILKPLTMLFIIWFAAKVGSGSDSPKYKRLIIIGLICSIVGDIMLLSKGNQPFIVGLFSFLMAHVVYFFAFMTQWKFKPAQLFVLIPIVIYAVFFLNELHTSMFADNGKAYDKLWIPVVLYVVVISSMIFSSVISRNKLAIAGAVLFFISDSLLAWNMFVTPMPWLGGYGVMITYYTAQFLIANSITVRERTSSSKLYKL
ncbi:lysoplasmalogenase [Brevibacillus ginsengisoli]|uniref:lysoplasmalogenase n=1 Tax=Brevibacillus ginsengisoli TaxID=363854 RepID=UPI003CFBA9AC